MVAKVRDLFSHTFHVPPIEPPVGDVDAELEWRGLIVWSLPSDASKCLERLQSRLVGDRMKVVCFERTRREMRRVFFLVTGPSDQMFRFTGELEDAFSLHAGLEFFQKMFGIDFCTRDQDGLMYMVARLENHRFNMMHLRAYPLKGGPHGTLKCSRVLVHFEVQADALSRLPSLENELEQRGTVSIVERYPVTMIDD